MTHLLTDYFYHRKFKAYIHNHIHVQFLMHNHVCQTSFTTIYKTDVGE